VSDDPASVQAFEWETTMAFANELAQPWEGMGAMANTQRRLAAEMIVKLYNRCTMEAQHIMELRQQVKDLRGERDEARREACKLDSRLDKEYGNTNPKMFGPTAIADQRGWDCYKDSK